ADNEYDPNDYRQLLEAAEDNKNTAVYGNRFSKGFVNGMTIKQKAGNLIMTALFNILMGEKLRDMETCYKMFPREGIDPANLQSTGFGIDPEITARLIKSGLRIKEIPISYYPRPYEAGKKIKLKDAFITFLTIIKYSIWL
ncbi:MAG: glycosyltransferase family 2 protein, partial [candidate division WOR-3 bacterium]|nr:glycosyltransferase family 2 protein [candidate division WOR-3 bacterium]